MSSSAVEWALGLDISAPRKVLLIGLAWVASDDGATIKSQATIGRRLGKDARWVREHMGKLAEDGLISRYRRHRINGSRTTDLVVLNMPREEPFDLSIHDGLVGEREPGDQPPTGGNPPGGLPAGTRRPSGGNPPAHDQPDDQPPKGKKDTRAGAQEDAFPEDLPSSMHEVAIAAGKILKRTAETRGQKKPVTRAAVGQAILTYPDRDFVQVAREVENWLLHGRGARRACADIVQRYGNFLKNSDMVAGPPLPQGVTPLHGRPSGGGRPSASDLLREIGARHVDRG